MELNNELVIIHLLVEINNNLNTHKQKARYVIGFVEHD